MKRDKKGSLTRELAVILVGLVAGTIMLCWFINTSFLEKYYMLNKQDSLIDGYDVINGASETGELNSSEFDVTFDNLCVNCPCISKVIIIPHVVQYLFTG